MENKKLLTEEEINRILYSTEIGYKKGFIDGYNMNCPEGEEASEEDFEDLLTPAIEKSREELWKKNKGR